MNTRFMMKKVLIILVAFLVLTQLKSQTIPKPIPQLSLTSSHLDSLGGHVSNYEENRSTTINSSNGGTYNENNDLEAVWYYPNSTPGYVGQYEKLELGLKLPALAEEQINNFLVNSPQTKLNPFNPNDVDVKAQFWFFISNKWFGPIEQNGFFYEEFTRNLNDADPNNWGWNKQIQNYSFRIRFAPTQLGLWRCKITANIKNIGTISTTDFTFNCTPSSNKGFVSVGPSKRFLKTGNESFFPTGQNLPHPTAGAGNTGPPKYTGIPLPGCKQITCLDEERCKPYTTMSPKGFMAYHEEMTKLKQTGGNYFRMMNFPFSYELEFEKLGDYSKRLNCAWELDQTIEKAKELGLKMHFTLSWGAEFFNAQYNISGWDWYANNSGKALDVGYCYPRELGLKDPHEFLTSTLAKKHYKNKLRYIIARWGYSTSIGIIELMNEINQPFRNHPVEIYEWQNEMASYIKKELNANQLIGINYAGEPAIDLGDDSYGSANIDVLSYNVHVNRVARGNLVKKTNHYVGTYQKPIIYSEIGTGDNGFQNCDNDTEYIKDAWLTSFVGAAGSGINWNNAHKYSVWNHLGNVQAFIGNLNLDRFYTTLTEERNDDLAEMMCIQEQFTDKKTIGIISNNTWNYYTNASGEKCASSPPSNSKHRKLREVKPGNWGNSIKISNMGVLVRYKIEWYDALTNTYLSESDKKSGPTGKLKLNHPTLSGIRPLVAFKVYKKTVGSFIAAPDESSTATQNKEVLLLWPIDESISKLQPTIWKN